MCTLRRAILALILTLPASALAFEPNDPYYPNWYSTKLRLSDAWAISQGSPSITVAVLDTGVISTTPDLGGRVLPALSGNSDPPLTGSNYHHGTWVSSVLAMGINNGIGGAGVGNFSILPISVTDASSTRPIPSADWIANGIRLAADHGAKAINISIGTPPFFLGKVDAAAAYARSKGALTFVAAGNSNQREDFTGFDNLIFVSGTNPADQRWDEIDFGSSFGPYVDLSAPAERLWVAEPNNPGFPSGYARASGTSFAAPLASAAAALAWSINPDLTPDQVRSMLFDTAVDLGPAGWDEEFGWGRLDIGAVAAAAQATVPEPGAMWGLCLLSAGLLRRPGRPVQIRGRCVGCASAHADVTGIVESRSVCRMRFRTRANQEKRALKRTLPSVF
jgi:subtilisin family serine protease